MSVIVYGPQGCGKSRNSEALRRHFKCTSVVEDDFGKAWDSVWRDPLAFKSGTTLYLTHEPPPWVVISDPRRLITRHVLTFDAAMAEIRAGR